MAEPVPGERGHAIIGLYPQFPECVGKLAGALVRVAIGVAMDAAFHRLRHDLGRAVVAVGMLDQAADQERHVHHQALHDAFLLAE